MIRGRLQMPKPGPSALLLGVLALLAAYLLTVWSYAPPDPLPADAPPEAFSATRALDALRSVLAEGTPHPVGSKENRRVRERLVGALEALGYEPAVQEEFVCGPKGSCAEVSNVVARAAGKGPEAVLLIAHHDSAPVSPGAADDGSGVAVLLEIARIMRLAGELRHPVIFLFTDGEEGGLLGARAFATKHAWSDQVGMVLNLDARGSGGPSLLFETSDRNVGLIELAADWLRRPVASSLFHGVYRRMPTDTDFSVMRDQGMEGANLAFLGDVFYYHTPLDTMERLHAGSVQHQGDNALDLLRGLEAGPLPRRGKSDAVFFDLFATTLIWWPSHYSLGLALAALYLLYLTRRFLVLHDIVRPDELRVGLLLPPLVLVSTTVLSALLVWLLQLLGFLPGWWIAEPAPALTALWAMALLVTTVMVSMLASRTGYWGMWIGVWSWWGFLALLAAALAPSACHVFLLPAATAGLVAVLVLYPGVFSEPAECEAAGVLPVLATGALWMPLVWLQFQTIGFAFKVPVALLAAMVLLSVAPLLVDQTGEACRWIRRLALLTLVGACVSVCFTQAYSEDAPQRVSIVHHQPAQGEARWLLDGFFGPPPLGLQAHLEVDPSPLQPFPWSGPLQLAYQAPAPRLESPAPDLEVFAQEQLPEGRKLKVRLQSPRGARVAGLLLPPEADVREVRVAGEAALPTDPDTYEWSNGWQSFSCLTLPLEGRELQLTLGTRDPVSGFVYDRSPADVPAALAELVRSRPAEAVPSHHGDGSLMTRRIDL